MLMTKDEFDKVFTAEHKRFLLKCIHEGLADYNSSENYGAGARRVHSKSARALLRHCHIVDRISRALLERSDIRCVVRRGRTLFIFDDKLQFSIKKFDGRLLTSSTSTEQATAFKAQLPLGLDEPPKLTNLFAGYRYDRTETQFEVYVTCPNDEQNFWVWKISGAEITDFFSKSSANIDDVGAVSLKKRRVHLRPDAKKKVKENE